MSSTKQDPHRWRRKSLRRPGFNYTQPGDYFLTLCTHQHAHIFGEIVNSEMILSDFGRVVRSTWQRMMRPTSHFTSPVWVIMPNHFHAIVRIHAPTTIDEPPPIYPDHVKRTQVDAQSLSAVLRTFKSVSTRRINQMRHTPGNEVWQRNFHDQVIENQQEYYAITNYIRNNPSNWLDDPDHLENWQVDAGDA